MPVGITVIQWITDFSARIKQLQLISEASQQSGPSALKSLHVWLGGLFIAEAYITATRQYVAQANSWSLEELYLEVGQIALLFWLILFLQIYPTDPSLPKPS